MVWFGFHCGAGFASGAQVKLYAAKYGFYGLAVPFIAWAINCVFMYIVAEYSRLIKAKSYRDVGVSIYWDNPVVGRIALLLWDILIFMSSITLLGSCVAGFGAQLTSCLVCHTGLGVHFLSLLWSCFSVLVKTLWDVWAR